MWIVKGIGSPLELRICSEYKRASPSNFEVDRGTSELNNLLSLL
jgi:hypothetical protein